jgi:hypothetical protein
MIRVVFLRGVEMSLWKLGRIRKGSPEPRLHVTPSFSGGYTAIRHQYDFRHNPVCYVSAIRRILQSD